MKHSFLIAATLITLSVAAQTTTRTRLRPKATANENTAVQSAPALDTIAVPTPHSVDINGYDKPLRSRRETFFVSNNTDKKLQAIALTITYFDSSRRQLHRRSEHILVEIPAGETRQAALRSWDIQQSFYYSRSAVPARTSQATPYEVSITVDSLFVNPL